MNPVYFLNVYWSLYLLKLEMALRARPYGSSGAQFIIVIEHQLKYVVDGQRNAPIVVT